MVSYLLLVTGLLLTVDEPQVIPTRTEETAKLGRLLVINVKANGKIVKWVKSSDDVDLITLTDDGKRIIFNTMTPGKHRIYGYTALGDVPSEAVVITITAGDGVGPQPPVPPPVPPPIPPTPDNPLTAKFQKEYDKDISPTAEKAKWKNQIVALFEELVKHVNNKNVATVGDLLFDYEKARETLVQKGVLNDLRLVIGKEIFAVVGDDPDKSINVELKLQLVDCFTKIANALKGVK